MVERLSASLSVQERDKRWRVALREGEEAILLAEDRGAVPRILAWWATTPGPVWLTNLPMRLTPQ
jgi:hypothetical protein